MRFGHGTWSSILAERQKRIREAKEAERIRIKERQKRIADIQETLTIIAISVAAIGVVLTALFFFSMARL